MADFIRRASGLLVPDHRAHRGRPGLLHGLRPRLPGGRRGFLPGMEIAAFGADASDDGPGVNRGLVAWYDAGNALSYSGSGIYWNNLAVAPADGAAQSAYKLRRGDGATSTTYPTFTGSAGSSAAYWAFDGGDYFELDSHSNTTFLNSLHKDNAVFSAWFVYWLNDTTDYQCIFSTGTSTGDVGVFFGAFNSTNKTSFTVLRGTGGSTALNKEGDTALSTGAWVFEGLSVDEAGNGFLVRNGAYLPVSAANTWTAAYSSPSASNSGYATIGASNSLSYKLRNGGRMAVWGMHNVALTLAEMSLIYTKFHARY